MNKKVSKALEIAKNTMKIQAKKVREFETCLYHGICPTCGKNLQLADLAYPAIREELHWFKNKQITYLHPYIAIICPEHHRLTHPAHGGDCSDPGFCFHHNLNHPVKEIRDYLIEHYSSSLHGFCEDDDGGYF